MHPSTINRWWAGWSLPSTVAICVCSKGELVPYYGHYPIFCLSSYMLFLCVLLFCFVFYYLMLPAMFSQWHTTCSILFISRDLLLLFPWQFSRILSHVVIISRRAWVFLINSATLGFSCIPPLCLCCCGVWIIIIALIMHWFYCYISGHFLCFVILSILSISLTSLILLLILYCSICCVEEL